MNYIKNLKGGVIEKISTQDVVVYQDEINKNNYDIKLTRIELNDFIFALNGVITDIKNNQNKKYIIYEIENIINKLKKADVPPKNYFATAPTFSTVDLNGYMNNYDNNTLITDMNNNQIDNEIYATQLIPVPKENMEKYEGPTINGKKEGKGVYIYENGCKYEGYFKNDKKEGSGIFYYTNGDRYKGGFQDGSYHGKGIFYFNNGDRYEGEFNKNKYSGKGKYFYHNGDKFEGHWLNDKKNGQGIYTYINGDKIIGNYYEGKPIGTHIKYSTNGKMYQINYSKS